MCSIKDTEKLAKLAVCLLKTMSLTIAEVCDCQKHGKYKIHYSMLTL